MVMSARHLTFSDSGVCFVDCGGLPTIALTPPQSIFCSPLRISGLKLEVQASECF